MDETQRKHERTVGESFVDWYNRARGRNFAFDSRPREAPHLLYRDGEEVLQIEVGQAYYDALDAAALFAHVTKVIADRCTKCYGSKCVLVMNVYPPVTGIDQIDARLGEIEIPHSHPFDGIYLTGHFGQDLMHPDRPSGFRCWKLG